MASFVNQMVEMAQRLRGIGFNINNERIGSLLLAGLPEKFSSMLTIQVRRYCRLYQNNSIKTVRHGN